ncbi:MAG: hypothetical protein ACI9WC_002297, partial [Arenicella sp.]
MKFTICSKPRLTSIVIGVGAVFAAASPAFAQRSTIEEVVVTAQHRTQSIQDVPITVT